MLGGWFKFSIIGLVVVLFSLTSRAENPFFGPSELGDWPARDYPREALISHLRWEEILSPGDVILLPLNCYSCRYIEGETGRPFSHSAVVLGKRNGEILVAEALGEVHTLSLSALLKKARANLPWVVMRPSFKRNLQKSELIRRFRRHFSTLSFDHEYRWNDRDDRGKERLYCSEFVAKFLKPFLREPLSPQKMSFTKFPDFWRQYYEGDIPSNRPGLSPADLFSIPKWEVKVWDFVFHES